MKALPHLAELGAEFINGLRRKNNIKHPKYQKGDGHNETENVNPQGFRKFHEESIGLIGPIGQIGPIYKTMTLLKQ